MNLLIIIAATITIANCATNTTSDSSLLCPLRYTETLTNYKNSSGVLSTNNNRYPVGTYFKHEGELKGCICKVRHCIRKCCGNEKSYLNDNGVPKCAEHINSPPITLKVHQEKNHTKTVNLTEFHIINSQHCNGSLYTLMPKWDEFYVQEDGTIYLAVEDGPYFDFDQYCVELERTNVTGEEHIETNFYHCASLQVDELEEPISQLMSVGMIISIPFLLATLFVYAVLPEKRKLHGKCLMCFVSSLTMAYLLLIYIQFDIDLPSHTGPCVTTAILCLFFFLTSFFWMNIMCTDIWIRFSGKRKGLDRNKDNRRFLIYAAIAFVIPLILSLIVAIVNTKYYGIPEVRSYWYYPSIADGQCWIRSDYPVLLYFYGPMSILICINVFFFIKTALLIKRFKKDTKLLSKKDNKTHGRDEEKQQMFKLYIKLLIVMGINWSMEIISWAVNWAYNNQAPRSLWYVTDLCNALYGVFIFFIFAFKWKTWRSLKKRYYIFMGKPMQTHASSSGTSQSRVSTVASEDPQNARGGSFALRNLAKK